MHGFAALLYIASENRFCEKVIVHLVLAFLIVRSVSLKYNRPTFAIDETRK